MHYVIMYSKKASFTAAALKPLLVRVLPSTQVSPDHCVRQV